MKRAIFLAFCLSPIASAAQDVDIDSLLASIDQRAGQYAQLTEILRGTDPIRALAAFDVMLESGNKSLRETAISAATSATDERLRARALWETLVEKDSITVAIDTEGLNEEARKLLDAWVGSVSTWSITARFPETQCLNLYRTNACEKGYHLSVSGLKVDMLYRGTVSGAFTLSSEGVLEGQVMNLANKIVYNAKVQLR